MKLSESLEGIGRAVAYFPKLAKFLGGIKAGVVFGQLFYCSKDADELGWFSKSQEELAEETGATIAELRAVRQELGERGILQCRYARMEHRLYFRIDRARLDDLWLKYLARNGHVRKSDMPPWEIADEQVRKVDFVPDPEDKENKRETRDKSRAPAPASGKNDRRKPEIPWPDDLALTPEMIAFAAARQIDAAFEFEKWRRYCKQHDVRACDWSAAWELRVMRAVEHARVASNGIARVDGLRTFEQVYGEKA